MEDATTSFFFIVIATRVKYSDDEQRKNPSTKWTTRFYLFVWLFTKGCGVPLKFSSLMQQLNLPYIYTLSSYVVSYFKRPLWCVVFSFLSHAIKVSGIWCIGHTYILPCATRPIIRVLIFPFVCDYAPQKEDGMFVASSCML